ncbi:hypothetical protein HK101_011053, partial [Irineochytrium annulatum]
MATPKPTSPPPSSRGPAIGSVFTTRSSSQYLLQRKLGSGSFSTVYLATCVAPPPHHPTSANRPSNLSAGDLVALKCIVKGMALTSAKSANGSGERLACGTGDDGEIDADGRSRRRDRVSAQQRKECEFLTRLQQGSPTGNKPASNSAAAGVSSSPARQEFKPVVELYEVVETEDLLLMVLEYCEIDLFQAISQNGGFPQAVVKGLFPQIADALLYCHERGIYHRDLKPENILVNTADYSIRIADFGLATDQPWSIEMGCGSLRYMSPECMGVSLYPNDPSVASSSTLPGYASAPNDVWSLGIILLNLIFARNPWHSPADPFCIDLYLRRRQPVLMSEFNISPEFDAVLRRCFDPNPDNRATIHQLRNLVVSVPWFIQPARPTPPPAWNLGPLSPGLCVDPPMMEPIKRHHYHPQHSSTSHRYPAPTTALGTPLAKHGHDDLSPPLTFLQISLGSAPSARTPSPSYENSSSLSDRSGSCSSAASSDSSSSDLSLGSSCGGFDEPLTYGYAASATRRPSIRLDRSKPFTPGTPTTANAQHQGAFSLSPPASAAFDARMQSLRVASRWEGGAGGRQPQQQRLQPPPPPRTRRGSPYPPENDGQDDGASVDDDDDEFDGDTFCGVEPHGVFGPFSPRKAVYADGDDIIGDNAAALAELNADIRWGPSTPTIPTTDRRPSLTPILTPPHRAHNAEPWVRKVQSDATLLHNRMPGPSSPRGHFFHPPTFLSHTPPPDPTATPPPGGDYFSRAVSRRASASATALRGSPQFFPSPSPEEHRGILQQHLDPLQRRMRREARRVGGGGEGGDSNAGDAIKQ